MKNVRMDYDLKFTTKLVDSEGKETGETTSKVDSFAAYIQAAEHTEAEAKLRAFITKTFPNAELVQIRSFQDANADIIA